MQRAKTASWAFVAGMIVIGGMLAACDGANDPLGSGLTNTVTLSWQAPTENTNGTPLTDLSGYTIHYGTQPQSYTNSIQITNPGLTTYVVDNLSPGTYYFAVTASTSDGFQSTYSPEVSATVN